MSRLVLAHLSLILFVSFCFPVCSCAACPEMPSSAASQRMAVLEKEIRYHNQLYYEKAQPVITDTEYDRLFAELLQLERCFPALIAPDTPTRRIGAGLDGTTQTVQHEQPMLSLSSSAGPEAVTQLLKRLGAGEVTLLVQPKVDGLPVELVYEAGQLISAATRGDGRAGVDVTMRIREIEGIPKRLTGMAPERVVVRGEIYADLRFLQKQGAGAAVKKYATPRHLAAGVLQSQSPAPEEVAALRLFPFQLVTATRSVVDSCRSDQAALQMLADWGFPVAFDQTRSVQTFDQIQAVYRDYLVHRSQQPFAMDGIVVKIDDLALRRRLGEGERSPLWAAAWKFPPHTTQTRVRSIRWTVGRTGRRTPIAELVPVRLGGVLVSRASLHTGAGIAHLDITAGDQVIVGLVGDVIPQVLEVISKKTRVQRIDTPLPLPEPALDACLQNSPGCQEQFLAKAVFFVSRSGLAIKGLGRKRLQKLVEAGLLNDLPSLFLLKTDAMAAVPGFGSTTARQIMAEIHAAAHPEPFRLLAALGIPGVGPKAVQGLSQQFSTLDTLLSADLKQSATLSAANGRALKTVRRFFHSPGGKKLLVQLRKQGVV